MRAVLCDTTALAYWRRNLLAPAYPSRVPEHKGHIHLEAPTAATLADIVGSGLADSDDVHLLLPDKALRRHFHGVSYTLCAGPYPAGSFVRVLGRIYVVCPELLFTLLARSLPLARLLEVGYELCGTYRLAGDAPTYGLEPATSVSHIRAYLGRASGMRGVKNARAALPWLMDGSASPAETALAIAFKLPYRLGGYNLGSFRINHRIELNEAAKRILGRDSIRPDFYWPQHPVEYDSALYHSGREQADYDERRRNAYAAMGMSVTVLRPRHIMNCGLLDEMVATIRRNARIERSRLPDDYEYRKDRLHDDVFRFWRDAHGAAERIACLEEPIAPW